jgi:hypothetical protein
MTASEYYAHSRPARPQSEWHRLEDHLKATAELARKSENCCLDTSDLDCQRRPRAGAWIETLQGRSVVSLTGVAPCAGAMANPALRARLGLNDARYVLARRIIRDTINASLVRLRGAPRKAARYVPSLA